MAPFGTCNPGTTQRTRRRLFLDDLMPPRTTTVFFGWKVVATASVIATCAFGFGYFGPAVFLNVLHT
jgi:hypothetical protein